MLSAVITQTPSPVTELRNLLFFCGLTSKFKGQHTLSGSTAEISLTDLVWVDAPDPD